MKRIFVDTSGWANLAYTSEPYYQLATEIYVSASKSQQRLVTTNYIIAELVPLLTSVLKVSRPRIIDFINGIKSSQNVDFIHIDKVGDSKAWELLENRKDKTWSLVDSSSFVTMEALGITDALTTDHHFEQAGFVRLLGNLKQ